MGMPSMLNDLLLNYSCPLSGYLFPLHTKGCMHGRRQCASSPGPASEDAVKLPSISVTG